MLVTTNVLMVDEDQTGFVTAITVKPVETSDTLPVSEPIHSEAVSISWETAQVWTRKTLEIWGRKPKKLQYTIGESDLNRTSPFAEGTDGKSLGMAFYIASMAATFGIQIRQDVAFTGCIEDSGHFRYPGALEQKVLGEFGAISNPKIKTVVVAPPPSGSSDLSTKPKEKYKKIREQFKRSSSKRKFLKLDNIESLWQPHIISQIFEEKSYVRFGLANKQIFAKLS